MAKSKIESEQQAHSSLSTATMVLAVQAEKERRAAKGYSFHCFVVDGKVKTLHPPMNEKLTELEFTLRVLRSEFNRGAIKDGTRVQLLVKNGVHWTTVDLEFNKAKGVSAFVLDAAKDMRYIETVSSFYKTFKKLPHEIYVCAGGLQYDHTNCAVFSLHHAFKASKIGDLHDDLKARAESFEEECDLDRVIHRVSHNQLPPSLLATIQRPASAADYLKINPGVADQPITKKGSTLKQLVESHTEEVHGRFTNTYISKVREKAAEKAKAYLERLDDPALANVLNFRRRLIDEMTEIKDPSGKPAYHVRSVSGQLSIEQSHAPSSAVDVSEQKITHDSQTRALQDAEPPIIEETPFVAKDLMIDKQHAMKEDLQSSRESASSTAIEEDDEPTLRKK